MNWERNTPLSFTLPRKEASISESESPIWMPFTAPSSPTPMVTSKVPVRPLAWAVYVFAPSGMETSTAGAGSGSSMTRPWDSIYALFTAATTALEDTVAPLTRSTSASFTSPVTPMNWERNALLPFTMPRNGTSLSVLASPIAMPFTAPSSPTPMVTSKEPVKPLAWAVYVFAPSGMDTSTSTISGFSMTAPVEAA